MLKPWQQYLERLAEKQATVTSSRPVHVHMQSHPPDPIHPGKGKDNLAYDVTAMNITD